MKNNKLWIIIGIIVILIALNQQPIDDKKESTSELGKTFLGVAMIIAGIAIIVITGGTAAPVGITIAIGGGAYMFGSGIMGLLTPDVGIPAWAWIVGFFVLIIALFRKKK